jgi:cytochrome c peroxidase
MEQNLPSAQVLCQRVKDAHYAYLFKQAWKDIPLTCATPANVQAVYDAIGKSIAAYERSYEVSAFTSKYDSYLKGRAHLTTQEAAGLDLFEGKAKCSGCHVSEPAGGKPPMFTDYTYDNLGVPRNPLLPFYYELWANSSGTTWVDPGLGGYLKSAGADSSVYEAAMGKMKVPTLRNVDKRPYAWFVKDYTHNGYFKSLEAIVHFYNTRKVLDTCAENDGGIGVTCWPPPENDANVNTTEVGNLGLSDKEEAEIVAFLKTLTDGYMK